MRGSLRGNGRLRIYGGVIIHGKCQSFAKTETEHVLCEGGWAREATWHVRESTIQVKS